MFHADRSSGRKSLRGLHVKDKLRPLMQDLTITEFSLQVRADFLRPCIKGDANLVGLTRQISEFLGEFLDVQDATLTSTDELFGYSLTLPMFQRLSIEKALGYDHALFTANLVTTAVITPETFTALGARLVELVQLQELHLVLNP